MELDILNKLCVSEVLICLVTHFFIACAENSKKFDKGKNYLHDLEDDNL